MTELVEIRGVGAGETVKVIDRAPDLDNSRLYAKREELTALAMGQGGPGSLTLRRYGVRSAFDGHREGR